MYKQKRVPVNSLVIHATVSTECDLTQHLVHLIAKSPDD